MSMCKEEGDDRIDEDRSALKEAKEGRIPNASLLKARLLFDGGYLDRALEILSNVDIMILNQDEILEHAYRKGRIYQEKGHVDQALINFSFCVNKGQDSDAYYRCGSALQLGNLYEQNGQNHLAREYFNKCLKINPSEYKNSLHQKAKAGLNRTKE